jgi:hypothetical protein
MAKIKIKNSLTSGLAPAGLSLGEVAINIPDKKIFIGNAVEGVVTLYDQQNLVTSVLGMTGQITELPALYRDDIYLYATKFNDGIVNYAAKSNYINESPWTFGGLTLSKNITDPFGVTNNAWTLTRNVINTTSSLEQNFSNIVSPIGSVSFYIQAIQGSTYTSSSFSVGTETYIPVGPGSTFYAEIIGGTGTISGNGTVSLSVSGLTYTEWTRIFVKNGINLPLYRFRLERTINYTGASGSNIAFFGLQYEPGLSANYYVDNNTISPLAGGGVTYNALGVSYDSTFALTNKTNTFTALQTFSSGLNVTGGVTFNDTLYVNGNISSGSDISANTFTTTNTVYTNDINATNQIAGVYLYINDGGVPTSSTINNSDLYLGDAEYYYSNKYIHIHNEESDGGGLVSVYSPSIFYEGVTFAANINAPNIVTSINGSTGAVVLTGLTASQVLTTSSNVNATRYLTFVGGTGTTGIFIDDVTTPLSYNPQQGNIGAKKATFTTSASVITVDSSVPTVILTDGVNITEFGLNTIAANNGTPLEISSTNGLTFSANAIAFAGPGYGYLFPAANGTNGQALTTNGAGTLSWSTITGGLSWSAVTADRSLVAEEGVLANKSSGTLTLTLPTTAALGKVIRVSGMQNTWRIAQNASQKINFGNRSTTTGTGGYLQNSNARDAVELVCCVANLEWNVISSIGNITIV